MTDQDVTSNIGSTGLSRRNLIKKGAVAGAIAWAAPVMLSATNVAAAASPCPPCTGFPYSEDWTGVAVGAVPGGYTTYNNGAVVKGWTVTNKSIDSIWNQGSYANYPTFATYASTGSTRGVVLELAGTPTGPGGIKRSFTFCEGTYDLVFELGSRAIDTLNYGASGILGPLTESTVPGYQNTVTAPFSVGPGGATTDVYFYDTSTSGFGLCIGKITITQTCL